MRTVYLYPSVSRKPRLFTGVKRVTLPNQCMSLAEMFRRFVRREPLPAEKNGMYLESDYDLEKISKLDRVEQDEILEEMKFKTSQSEAKVKAAKAKVKKAADDAKALQDLEDSRRKQLRNEGVGKAPVSGSETEQQP